MSFSDSRYFLIPPLCELSECRVSLEADDDCLSFGAIKKTVFEEKEHHFPLCLMSNVGSFTSKKKDREAAVSREKDEERREIVRGK